MEEMTEAEEKALRESAYNDEPEPEQSEQPPQEAEPEVQEPEQEVQEEEDPWAGVPSALREQIQSISTRVAVLDEFENRLKQAERRVGGIQNEIYNQQKAEPQKPAPTEKEVQEAAEKDESWEEMREDFPDLINAIEKRFAANKPVDKDALRQEILSEMQQQQTTGEPRTDEDLERRLVGIQHPDWQELVQTDDYQNWLKAQPLDVQRKALYGQTAEDAIAVLNKYKNKPKPKQQSRLERSVDAPRGPTQRPPKSEADLSEDELRKRIAAEVWDEG